MTTSRPYRRALTEERASDELCLDAARGTLNMALVEVFVGMIRNGLARSVASLARGEDRTFSAA